MTTPTRAALAERIWKAIQTMARIAPLMSATADADRLSTLRDDFLAARQEAELVARALDVPDTESAAAALLREPEPSDNDWGHEDCEVCNRARSRSEACPHGCQTQEEHLSHTAPTDEDVARELVVYEGDFWSRDKDFTLGIVRAVNAARERAKEGRNA